MNFSNQAADARTSGVANRHAINPQLPNIPMGGSNHLKDCDLYHHWACHNSYKIIKIHYLQMICARRSQLRSPCIFPIQNATPTGFFRMPQHGFYTSQIAIWMDSWWWTNRYLFVFFCQTHIITRVSNYPLVICYIAIENGHRNRWFSQL